MRLWFLPGVPAATVGRSVLSPIYTDKAPSIRARESAAASVAHFSNGLHLKAVHHLPTPGISMAEMSSSPAVAPPSRMSSTGAIREARDSSGSPTNSSSSSAALPLPAHRKSSTRSMLLSPSTPVPPQSRSGGRITPPVKAEMSITEQIARQTRKSTVLDPKNALLVMAIPDYDDYKIMQPYSCRSLSNKSKFVGGRDFVTRHNPQEVNDFKKQYSRDFGNLNRHRSILASPTSNLSTIGLFSSSSGSIGLQESPSKNGSISNNNLLSKDGALWRKAFTSTMKACWVLTEFGIQALIGPEYRLTTRTPVLPALPSPRPQRPPILTLSCRSPATSFRPETPSSLSAFSARESARKGIGVDLADDKTLAALSRLAVSTPKLRSPPSSPLKRSTKPNSESVSTPPSSGACTDGAEMLSLAPYADISWELKDECDRNQTATSFETTPATQQKNVGVSLASTAPSSSLPVVSSTTQHFAMEVSPPMLALGTLQTGQVYLFPVRVRNVGSRQERFRVNRVAATCAGFEASIAEASYQRESARLAPGLAAIVTVALSFHHPGRATGSLRVEAEGLGACDIDIKCIVR